MGVKVAVGVRVGVRVAVGVEVGVRVGVGGLPFTVNPSPKKPSGLPALGLALTGSTQVYRQSPTTHDAPKSSCAVLKFLFKTDSLIPWLSCLIERRRYGLGLQAGRRTGQEP